MPGARVEPACPAFQTGALTATASLAKLVEEEGIEPSFAGCRPAVLPLNDSPEMTATLTRRAQSLHVERNLGDPWVGVDSVVEERLCCFGFALNFPNSGIRQVVWFLLEWRDKCRAEPLDAIIRLCGEVAIIECDEMSALVSAVSGFFGVLALTPINSEHVLAAFPRPILELDTDAGILKPLERSHRYLITEAIPELKPVERLHRSIRLVAESVEGKAPDDSAVLRQNMKAERAAVDRCRAKNANIEQFAMVRLTVIEEFLAQEAIEPRHVHVKCCQLRYSPPEFKY